MSRQYFQGGLIVAPYSVESETVIFTNKLMNLGQETLKYPGQRFTFSFFVESGAPLSVFAHVMARQGDTFSFSIPQFDSIKNALGALTTPLTAGSAVSTDLVTPTTGGATVGRFVTFNNHPKVYSIREVLSSGQLRLFPALFVAVVPGTIMSYGDNVVAQVMYSLDQLPVLTYEDGVLSSPLGVKLVEQVA